ncbi:unnamed protein product [Schistosoma curassoni]|uniref:DNA mismatch repair protein MutS n=1 Tax=Schistosoma curassoni TaxID=6186 RepID=A0A183KU77_9TREM|nr:unnamed protein product [Schistosoma curassoni]
MDDNNYEKSEYFYIQLGEPVLIDKDEIAVVRSMDKFRRARERIKG